MPILMLGLNQDGPMRKLLILVMLATALLPATGCGVFRATEQWKCDNLGLCLFGMRPSNNNDCPCNATGNQGGDFQDGLMPVP